MDPFTFITNMIWPAIAIGVLIGLFKPIKEFLETLAEWTEMKIGDIWIKRKSRAGKSEPPEPTGTEPPGTVPTLSTSARMVISTLWKHQQEYYTDHTQGRWSFIVGIGNLLYPDYSIGVGELMKYGLLIISPKNGQSLLTDAGIRFCQDHPDELLPDWNYGRWTNP